MIQYEEVIKQFESAYKHMGQCAEQFNREDIAFWERAGFIESITANVLRSINQVIAINGGKWL